jgi:hypothetical protein
MAGGWIAAIIALRRRCCGPAPIIWKK